ncbi:MAG: hypothetical protein FJ279_23280, partial [Planctomycetes bacterium]|nr:hypothetical protein [Planctomycetota bacterium]
MSAAGLVLRSSRGMCMISDVVAGWLLKATTRTVSAMSHEMSLGRTAEARTPTTHYSPLTICAVALLWLLALAPAWAADWTIVKATASTEMDSLAASELRKYVGLMTGNRPPIITDTQMPATASVFLVGKAETHRAIRDLAGRGLVRLSATEPGPQGFINKTVDADGRHYVVLAGGDDLGVQYAVYDFLESFCKVGFLLDGEHVPRVESLEVKALDVSKKPFCQFRQQSAYGKCKLWYGAGTWPSLSTFEKDGYKTGWKDFIDWMIKKKQNVLYLKRGFFNVGYALGFPEMNNPRDLESIELEGAWFRTPFTADLVAQLISYARSRGMKTCYTATICRMPVAFKRHIQDPRHPCHGLKYEEKGNWIRLDPLDDRSYSYCLRRHAEAIVKKFGKPDFWYGYYGWSEQPPSMGLKARSHCHYKAHDLAFRHTGGALLVYTWDWGWHNMPFAEEWDHFKRVMPRDGSVVVAVNTGPGAFLKDPAGPFAGFPWWQYLTSTADDQCLPEQFRTLRQSYADWRALLTTAGGNPPQGFGLDNMIHHVDQRLTDFECGQAFTPTAHHTTLDAYLADYVARAYGSGPHTDDLLRLHKLWADQRKVTHAQVEQSMTP